MPFPLRTRSLLLCLAALLALPALAAAAGNDWPQWRGPDRSGKSPEKGLLQAWPTGGPQRLWMATGLGQGDGSVVMQGDQIFVQGTRGEEGRLFCLRRGDGTLLWEAGLGPKYVNGNNPGECSTPTIDGDRVYALSGYGLLICAKTSDGSILWQVHLAKDLKGRSGGWGYSESPLVEGNLLIVSPGAPQATIVALDKMTGKLVWASKGLSDLCSYASPIAVDLGSRRVIIAFTGAAGVGLDASDGALLWRYAPPANGTANASTPIFHDNKVFYTSDYGTGGGLLELAPMEDRVVTRQVYFNKAMKNHFGGVVLLDGFLYGASGAVLACMNFDTGKLAWRHRGIGKSALSYADGRLYLINERGEVALVESTPKFFRLISRFRVPNPTAPARTAPVVCDGRLYVRYGDNLACYDIRAAKS